MEIILKICSKCNIEKPISEFWKRKETRDGYRTDCKDCIKNKNSYINDIFFKVCGKCKVEKTSDKFSKSKYGKNGVYSICKECKKQYELNNKDRFKEKNSEKSKKYYQKRKIDPLFLEKRRKNTKNWQRQNIEKRKEYCKNYNEINKERISERNKKYLKKWRESENGKIYMRNNWNLRRNLIKESDITIDWLKDFVKNSSFCELCKCELKNYKGHPESRQLDHIIPVNIGGTHTKDNVRYLCRTCNLRRPKNGSDLNKEILENKKKEN